MFSLENCFGLYFCCESGGALCPLWVGGGTRSQLLRLIIMTVKRLTDGCGARNGFGPKGRRVSSIAELEWWMEGFGWRTALWKVTQRPQIEAIVESHFSQNEAVGRL